MDFDFRPPKKRMREKDMVLSCNFRDSKDDPLMLKPKPVIQDHFKPRPVTMNESIINKLPPEILAYIFCKFPAVYLHSLRRVCKFWDLLIRENSFIEEHFNSRVNAKEPGIISLSFTHQPENQGGITHYSSYCSPKYFSIMFYVEGGSSVSFHHEIIMNKYMYEPYYNMTNSCHGLICVVGLVSTIVMNPSIGRLRALPKASLHFQDYKVGDTPLAGIGFDSSTRTYKVVRIFRDYSLSKRNNDKWIVRCEIYTLGRGCSSWKSIGKVSISPDAFKSWNNYPVVVNDAIHWIINSHDKLEQKIVLSFSVKDETFSLICHPEGITHVNSSLAELEGCLSLCDTFFSTEQMDVWMLKDYDNREWVKQYSISFRTMYNWSVYDVSSMKPVTIRDGKLVLYNAEGRMDYYDLESKNFVEHAMLVVDSVCCAPYVGGLIWPEQ